MKNEWWEKLQLAYESMCHRAVEVQRLSGIAYRRDNEPWRTGSRS